MKKFMYGVSTSAFQIEGDGKFEGTAFGGSYTKLTGNIKPLSYYALRGYRYLSEEDTVCEGVASAIAVTAYGANWFVVGYWGTHPKKRK